MALNLDQNSTASNTPTDDIEDVFYAIIDRLKAQKALPHDSFIKQMPFFNFSSISKESQVKELFQDINDPNFYRSLVKNIISSPDEKDPELITKRLSAMQVMGFAQICLYKVLQCPEENCPNRPREVATHNQYKDYEYQCPFYHHDKDHRRMVIAASIDDEFTYKANYYEEGKRCSEKDKHSQNYFESMFHPLYYKMFRCKREYCNFSQFCPFFHSEEEKKTWDRTFSNFIRKDRISYVKDKQKYYEHNNNSNNVENKQAKSNNNDQANNKANNNSNNSPHTPNLNNQRNNRTNRKPKTPNPKYQGQTSPPGLNPAGEWRSERFIKQMSAKKWDNRRPGQTFRKGSGESNESNSSPIMFGNSLYDQREAIFNRAC
jgi:hypothetical protein